MFIIYTKKDCPICYKTIQLLYNESKLIIECDTLLKVNKQEFINSMQKKTKLIDIYFPMVFINDTFIGNYDNLLDYITWDDKNDFFC